MNVTIITHSQSITAYAGDSNVALLLLSLFLSLLRRVSVLKVSDRSFCQTLLTVV